VKPIVPPPYAVQRRAWECAYALHQEFFDRLPIADRVATVVVEMTHPDGLGWHDCARMLVLYRETVSVRV
jgi:hypothetical protein